MGVGAIMFGIEFPNGTQKHWDPNQLEIQYFWPLTEQLSLDLDYSPCREYQNRLTGTTISSSVLVSNGATNLTWISQTPSKVCIDTENLTVLVKRKPNLFKRAIIKALNMKWQIK